MKTPSVSIPQAHRLLVTCWIALFCFCVWGCDDAVIDPFKNDGKYYTIYGFLDESKNFTSGARQALRIIPVTRRAAQISSPSDPDADFDGRVFLTDVNLEQTREIPRELKELQPGVWGHIFETQLFVQPNHVYKIEIVRSDGIITSAETHVPATSGMRIIQDAPAVNADTTVITQDIRIDGTRSLWEADVIYYTAGGSCFTATANTIPYGRAGALNGDMWQLQLNISDDLASLGLNNATICAMGLRARVLDDQWLFPEGTLDLEDLTLPQTLTNVDNGYGFFGSMGFFQADWQLLTEVNDLLNSGS